MENTTESVKSGFLRNVILVALFFIATPLVLTTSLVSLITLSTHSQSQANIPVVLATKDATQTGVRIYASLPSELPAISGFADPSDARVELIRNYLFNYNSPLAPYAEDLVNISDKYLLDYRLLTAIAQQESNLCKVIPEESYNCWGWGIHSKGSLGFSSYPEAIETVAKGIRTQYVDKGYTTVEYIMSKYTPKSNGSWAHGVNQFMEEVEEETSK